jgi:thiamine-phosphate pyrophosphorylase
MAQQLCDGGADLIQLRAKTSSPDEIRRMAEAILPITRRAGIGLVINDQVEIARDLGAELCHLGQEDFFHPGHQHVSELKTQNSKLKIGLSTHAPEQAKRALMADADYLAIGPVYATGTKPSAKPVTLEYVRWAAMNVKIPWFAIGGISLENLGEVHAAGLCCVCHPQRPGRHRGLRGVSPAIGMIFVTDRFKGCRAAVPPNAWRRLRRRFLPGPGN